MSEQDRPRQILKYIDNGSQLIPTMVNSESSPQNESKVTATNELEINPATAWNAALATEFGSVEEAEDWYRNTHEMKHSD